jgi:hypothetical protein
VGTLCAAIVISHAPRARCGDRRRTRPSGHRSSLRQCRHQRLTGAERRSGHPALGRSRRPDWPGEPERQNTFVRNTLMPRCGGHGLVRAGLTVRPARPWFSDSPKGGESRSGLHRRRSATSMAAATTTAGTHDLTPSGRSAVLSGTGGRDASRLYVLPDGLASSCRWCSGVPFWACRSWRTSGWFRARQRAGPRAGCAAAMFASSSRSSAS